MVNKNRKEKFAAKLSFGEPQVFWWGSQILSVHGKMMTI